MPPSSAPPGWDYLLTEAGLELLDRVSRDLTGGLGVESVGARLRRDGLEPDRVAAILTQAQLREKARAKFGDLAPRLLFTPAGLEQATRQQVAQLHAARFRAAGCRSVVDLGAGIGSDSIALARAGMSVTAIERDPFTAQVARHNLGAVTTELAAVMIGDAEFAELAHADGAFLDPARRTRGHSDTRRLPSPDDYSPSLTFAMTIADALPTGIKLGPGTDRSLIPSSAEAQWVSVDGQVVEMGLWFGAVQRPGVRRAATLIQEGVVHELVAPQDAADASVRPLGDYLYEPDGAVIRARLIGDVARELDAGHVSDGIAYLTGDRLVQTPFASVFRLVEELPSREKHLRRALQDRGIGQLEIKKRGVDLDPAALRARLKLRGDRAATLILTRAEGRHVALLAERAS